MEFKGTKGKWNLGYKTVKVNELSLLFMPIYKTVVSNKVIAVAYSEHGTENEVKANAQLIAHAPEMLEKLTECKTMFSKGKRLTTTDMAMMVDEITDLLTIATTI